MAFKIENKKKKSIIKSVRFPKELEIKIKKLAEGNDISFSTFVIEACLYAIKHLDEK